MKNFLPSFRQDFSASIVVFFVALPLCLGISLASGAPLFSGIIAGIVGGIIVGAISGSPFGVSGPSAGLAVFVFSHIASLGGSFDSFLLAVFLAGVIQVIAGFLRIGTIAYYFPSSVIKGMLSGIGFLIIIKQIPHALGYDAKFKDDFGVDNLHDFEVFKIFDYLLPNVIVISLISMLILILWDEFSAKKHKILKVIPGPLVAVIAGILLSKIIYLETEHMVRIPVSSGFNEIFKNFSLPDFSQFLNLQIYSISLVIAVVASLETLLCVEATDKLDPQKRITPVNRELKAQGIGNIISGLIGGLPITQAVVRSSANIEFGAKTKASSITHGFLLLISAITIPSLLNMIPLATLACILIMVGYKLVKSQIKSIFKEGSEQYAPFVATILGMLAFDLLKGVGIGMSVAIVFILYHNFQNAGSKIKESEGIKNTHKLVLSEEVSFLNKGRILQILDEIPSDSSLVIDGSRSKSIHYDIIEIIKNFQTNAKLKNISVEIRGIDLN